MAQAHKIAVAGLLVLFGLVGPPFSQNCAVASEAEKSVDQILDTLEAAPTAKRATVYHAKRAELAALAPAVPGLELGLYIGDVDLASAGALVTLDLARQQLSRATQGFSADQGLLHSIQILEGIDLPTDLRADMPTQLQRLSKLLERLRVAGVVPQDTDPDLRGLVDAAAAWGDQPADSLEAADTTRTAEFMARIEQLAPSALAGIIGPATNAKTEWDRALWNVALDLLEALVNAVEHGAIQADSLKAIASEIERLRTQSPWPTLTPETVDAIALQSGATAGRFMRLTRPSLARGPYCSAVSCDCDNIHAGLLNAAYKRQCKKVEASLIELCNNVGHVDGHCDAAASGPNANPP
jgi:hypothetical protein